VHRCNANHHHPDPFVGRCFHHSSGCSRWSDSFRLIIIANTPTPTHLTLLVSPHPYSHSHIRQPLRHRSALTPSITSHAQTLHNSTRTRLSGFFSYRIQVLFFAPGSFYSMGFLSRLFGPTVLRCSCFQEWTFCAYFLLSLSRAYFFAYLYIYPFYYIKRTSLLPRLRESARSTARVYGSHALPETLLYGTPGAVWTGCVTCDGQRGFVAVRRAHAVLRPLCGSSAAHTLPTLRVTPTCQCLFGFQDVLHVCCACIVRAPVPLEHFPARQTIPNARTKPQTRVACSLPGSVPLIDIMYHLQAYDITRLREQRFECLTRLLPAKKK
jgi:hypothetical protein